jgi:AcrR family transcriptional regulator
MTKNHDRGALPSALIQASLQLLDNQDIDAVSIRAVARLAGVSHAAPANHFVDRRALLTGVAKHCLSEARQLAQRASDQVGGSARTQLDAYVDAYVVYGLTYPNRYRLMWRMDLCDITDTDLVGLTDAYYDDVHSLVESLPAPDGIDKVTRVIGLCSIIHGYISMRIDGNFQPGTDEKTLKPRHLSLIDAFVLAN